MANTLEILGTQTACGATTAAASDFGKARYVRLFNSGTAAHLVTVEESDGTDVGTFSLNAKDSLVIHKLPSHKIFAANIAVLGTKVGSSSTS